jgi:hypothetical protein
MDTQFATSAGGGAWHDNINTTVSEGHCDSSAEYIPQSGLADACWEQPTAQTCQLCREERVLFASCWRPSRLSASCMHACMLRDIRLYLLRPVPLHCSSNRPCQPCISPAGPQLHHLSRRGRWHRALLLRQRDSRVQHALQRVRPDWGRAAAECVTQAGQYQGHTRLWHFLSTLGLLMQCYTVPSHGVMSVPVQFSKEAWASPKQHSIPGCNTSCQHLLCSHMSHSCVNDMMHDACRPTGLTSGLRPMTTPLLPTMCK